MVGFLLSCDVDGLANMNQIKLEKCKGSSRSNGSFGEREEGEGRNLKGFAFKREIRVSTAMT